MLFFAWLVLPSGDPSDVFVTIPLIAFLGSFNYLLFVTALLFLLLSYDKTRFFLKKHKATVMAGFVLVTSVWVGIQVFEIQQRFDDVRANLPVLTGFSSASYSLQGSKNVSYSVSCNTTVLNEFFFRSLPVVEYKLSCSQDAKFFEEGSGFYDPSKRVIFLRVGSKDWIQERMTLLHEYCHSTQNLTAETIAENERECYLAESDWINFLT